MKLEGGRPVVDAVRRLVDIGIPVMGHVGLQPQSVNQLGGYRKRGTHAAGSRRHSGRRGSAPEGWSVCDCARVGSFGSGASA